MLGEVRYGFGKEAVGFFRDLFATGVANGPKGGDFVGGLFGLMAAEAAVRFGQQVGHSLGGGAWNHGARRALRWGQLGLVHLA